MRHRRGLTVLGLFAIGAAMIVGGVAGRSVDYLVGYFGNDYIVVGIFAIIGLVTAVSALVSGRASNIVQSRMPEPEHPVSAQIPGHEIDVNLNHRWIDIPLLGEQRREAIRQRVYVAVVETIVRTEGISREEAKLRVADSSWTNDRRAGTFVLSSNVTGIPLLDQMKRILMGRHSFKQEFSQTVAVTGSITLDGDRNGDLSPRQYHESTTENGDGRNTGDRRRNDSNVRDGIRVVEGKQ